VYLWSMEILDNLLREHTDKTVSIKLERVPRGVQNGLATGRVSRKRFVLRGLGLERSASYFSPRKSPSS